MAQLLFKGKQFVQNHHLTVKYHELIPQKEKSLTDKISLHDNLIIHGDNLKALKALLPTYGGKIKCIYIDPPYNTGNEKWAYNDNVNSPMMQEWLGKVVDKEDLTRHDKWLCMMTPRLKLLRELLSDDGVIFISIDDNEQHRLRMLMDEIFSEENFIAQFVWKKKTGAGTQIEKVFSEHEYVVSYTKNYTVEGKWRIQYKEDGNFNNPDNDERGNWESCAITAPSKNRNPNQLYQIEIYYGQPKIEVRKSINGKKTIAEFNYLDHKIVFREVGEDAECYFDYDEKERNAVFIRRWSYVSKTFKRVFDEKRVYLKEGNLPRYKKFEKEYEGKALKSIYFNEFSTQEGGELLNEIMPGNTFEYPKPVSLIKHFIKAVTDKDSIVLDSFAGSGTTGHAVLDLNKEDDGDRKFILVECEDYADKITAERVRRVIKGVSNTKDENLKNGLGGSFSYFELGKPIEMESILSGKNLPTYLELARYVFYTATGEEFNEKAVDEKRNFIGENSEYEIYLFYKPNLEYLKNTALTLDRAKNLGPYKTKKRLVFAPTKYLDQDQLDQYRIDFAQLPFEIYKLAR